jgi:hypothetical protein
MEVPLYIVSTVDHNLENATFKLPLIFSYSK